MKGMHKIKRGKSPRGLTDYIAKKCEIVGGNMAGTTSRELANELTATSKIRPDIEKYVWHNSLRLPKGEKLENEKWAEIADAYMVKMGFTDLHQRVYALEDDPDGQHIHIAASRIALDGNVYLGRNENLKSTQYIQQIEKEFNLTITKGPAFVNGKIKMPEKANLKNGEIEMTIRTEEPATRLLLQKIIDNTMKKLKDKENKIELFLEEMEDNDITARPNIASTGKMNGFSFEYQGVAFKASQLGAKYKWQELSRGLDYEQDKHSEILINAKNRYADNTKTRIERFTATNATSAGKVGATNGTAGLGNDGPNTGNAINNEGNIEAINRIATQSGNATQRTNTNTQCTNKQRDSDIKEDTQASCNSNTASARSGGQDKGIKATANGQNTGTIVSFGNGSGGGGIQRIVDLSNGKVKSKSVEIKQRAWLKQDDALQADFYRVSLTARREGLLSYNRGKGKGPDKSEKFFTAQEINDALPELSRQNARGYDIYITPFSKNEHFLLLDDSNVSKIAELKQKGYTLATVLESSPDNLQAVFRIKKTDELKNEQTLANKVMRKLNTEYGDPLCTGAIHPFRMAGFTNAKEKYEINGMRPFCILKHATNTQCSVLNKLLEEEREAQRLEQKEMEEKRNVAIERNKYEKLNIVLNGNDIFQKQYKKNYGLAKKLVDTGNFDRVDLSSVDYNVCVELLKNGIDKEELKSLLLQYSPNIDERKHNPIQYAERTVESANKFAERFIQKQTKQQPAMGYSR